MNFIIVTNIKRDFQSGENVAFILNYYYSDNVPIAGSIDMKQLNRGTSFRMRDSNWALIRKFLTRPDNNNLIIPTEELNGIIHGKPGAAEVVIMRLYQYFSGNRIKTLTGEYEFNFS